MAMCMVRLCSTLEASLLNLSLYARLVHLHAGDPGHPRGDLLPVFPEPEAVLHRGCNISLS